MTDIERIKSILAEIEYDFISYGNLHDDDSHGLKVIKEALEKNVPKKPDRGKYGAKCCPCCGDTWNMNEYGEGMKYCWECGQAIDWSEEEKDGIQE